MNSLPWFKVYTDIIDEPKLTSLSEAQRWRFVQLLALAGECGAGGYLVSSGIPLPLEEMAWRLRVSVAMLKDDLAALRRTRLLVFDKDSLAWLVPSFAKRQGTPGESKRVQWKEQKRRQRQRRAEAAGLEEIDDINTIAAGEPFARQRTLAMEEDEGDGFAAGETCEAGNGLAMSNLLNEQSELEDDVLEDVEEGPDGHVRLKSRIEDNWTRPGWTKDEIREEGEERQGADAWEGKDVDDHWRPRDRSGPPTSLGKELKNFQRRMGKVG